MINKISPVSFKGLKIEGVINAKNMKKLREFATAEENTRFINDLETTFNTDMVMNGSFDKISFSHEYYGNLAEFGCPTFPTEGFYSNVVDVREHIKDAIKKAEKFSNRNREDYEKIRRGC